MAIDPLESTETPVDIYCTYFIYTNILYTPSSNISIMGKDKDKQVDALAGIPTDDDAGKCLSSL
jgi:hypothetical protein